MLLKNPGIGLRHILDYFFIESYWKTIFKNSSLKVLERIEKNQKKKIKYIKNPQTFFKIQVYDSKSPRKPLKQFLKIIFNKRMKLSLENKEKS